MNTRAFVQATIVLALALVTSNASANFFEEWADIDDGATTSYWPLNGKAPYRIAYLVDSRQGTGLGTGTVSLVHPLTAVWFVQAPDPYTIANGCTVQQWLYGTDPTGNGTWALEDALNLNNIPCYQDVERRTNIGVAQVVNVASTYLYYLSADFRSKITFGPGIAGTMDSICSNIVGWNGVYVIGMSTIMTSWSKTNAGSWYSWGNTPGTPLYIVIECLGS
jgi:hypothetical protein